jgi:hypothetical protein
MRSERFPATKARLLDAHPKAVFEGERRSGQPNGNKDVSKTTMEVGPERLFLLYKMNNQLR